MKRIAVISLLLCTLLIAPAWAEKYALLVGIDTYSRPLPALNGCVKDVEMMRAALISGSA